MASTTASAVLPPGIIVGGQNTFVKLTSSNITNTAGVFGFDVTVQNLIPQAMGTNAEPEEAQRNFEAMFADPIRRQQVGAAIANQAEHFDMLGLQLGYAYAAVGRPDSTRRILADIERRSRSEYFPKDQIAVLYFALGDRVRGLRALEQTIDEHHWWAPYLNNIAATQPLRADPEFRRLMKRINVPDAAL